MYDMQKNCSDGEFAFQARVLTIFSQQNLVTFLAIKKKRFWQIYLCYGLIVNYLFIFKEVHKHGLELWARNACFFFSAKMNSLFSTACSGVFFQHRTETPRFTTALSFNTILKPHVSSLAMTLWDISALHKSSDETCFDVVFAHYLRFETLSLKIFYIPESYIRTCSHPVYICLCS